MLKKTNLTHKFLIVCLFIFTAAASFAGAGTIYVDDSAMGG
jgi:hypothetical protein